jgi:hypothetical protein
MGRKRTHHDAARTKIVSARLRQETYDLMSEHAEKLGLSRAGYIEHLIENRPVRLAHPMTDALPVPLLNELKRIGNNLNQIAHARNAGLDVDPRQFQTVVAEIVATLCSTEVLKRRYEAAAAEVAGSEENAPNGEIQPRRAATAAQSPSASPPSNQEGGSRRPHTPPPTVSRKTAEDAADRPRENTPPPEAPTLRITDEDIAHRHGQTERPSDAVPETPRMPAAPRRTHDSKASSSWFKFPWRV